MYVKNHMECSGTVDFAKKYLYIWHMEESRDVKPRKLKIAGYFIETEASNAQNGKSKIIFMTIVGSSMK